MSINCVRCGMPAEFIYCGNSYCRPHFQERREQREKAAAKARESKAKKARKLEESLERDLVQDMMRG